MPTQFVHGKKKEETPVALGWWRHLNVLSPWNRGWITFFDIFEKYQQIRTNLQTLCEILLGFSLRSQNCSIKGERISYNITKSWTGSCTTVGWTLCSGCLWTENGFFLHWVYKFYTHTCRSFSEQLENSRIFEQIQSSHFHTKQLVKVNSSAQSSVQMSKQINYRVSICHDVKTFKIVF